MQVQNLAAGADEFTSNAFLIEETALIDAGSDRIVVERLEDVDIDTVVITHTHWDHVENLPVILDEHDATVYAMNPENLPVPAEPLEPGTTIELAGHTFDVIHTPGHKNDSICLYNTEEGVLFAGDLIFPDGSFGRTDLEEGDRDRLIESIKIFAERDVQALYAGHGSGTTEDVNEQIQRSLDAAKKHEPKY